MISQRAQWVRWMGLVAISLAVSLIIVDSTILSVAIPAIISDLHATSSQVQWLQEIYTLVFASLLLLFGTAADRYGRRRITLIGLSIFAAASLWAVCAPTTAILIVCRALQGFGCSMVLPGTLSLVNSNFHGRERGIAFAVWGSTIGGMAAIGPLLGGWIITQFSWRWVFGINIPLGIIIVIAIYATVSESRNTHTRNFDFFGSFLSALGAGTMVFALIEGRTFGWWKTVRAMRIGSWEWLLSISPIPFFCFASVLCLFTFIAWCRYRTRVGKDAVLDLSLFTITSFRNGCAAALTVSMGEFGIILSLPLWLQFVRGYSALDTGIILLTVAAGSFLASGATAGAAGKIAPTIVVRVGLLCEIAGLIATAAMLSPRTPGSRIVLPMMLYGFGVGLATAQLTSVILIDVPPKYSGEASGMQSTARQIGSALGIAILGTLLFSSTAQTLDADLAEKNVPPQARTGITRTVVDSAGGAIQVFDKDPRTRETAESARVALTSGTQKVALGASAFLFFGLIASFSLGASNRSAHPKESASEAPNASL